MTMKNENDLVKGMVNGKSEMPLTTFDDILGRIKTALGIDTDSGLTTKLGLTRQNIYNNRKRDAIPLSWLLKVHELTGISIDWLRTGIGPQKAESQVAEESPEYGLRQGKIGNDEWDILGKAYKIITSETVYKSALLHNINAFYDALKYRQEIDHLKARLQILEQAHRIREGHRTDTDPVDTPTPKKHGML